MNNTTYSRLQKLHQKIDDVPFPTQEGDRRRLYTGNVVMIIQDNRFSPLIEQLLPIKHGQQLNYDKTIRVYLQV